MELVSPQYSNRRQEFYLARRAPADSHLPGRPWHILGGMWRLTQTQQDAYTATALRDLALVVQSVRDVMTFKWPWRDLVRKTRRVIPDLVCQPRVREQRLSTFSW